MMLTYGKLKEYLTFNTGYHGAAGMLLPVRLGTDWYIRSYTPLVIIWSFFDDYLRIKNMYRLGWDVIRLSDADLKYDNFVPVTIREERDIFKNMCKDPIYISNLYKYILPENELYPKKKEWERLLKGVL